MADPNNKTPVMAQQWAEVWARVSNTSARIANISLRAALLGDKVDRSKFPKFYRWWSNLPKPMRAALSRDWQPLQPPGNRLLRTRPYLAVEIKENDYDHLEMNDVTEQMIADSIQEALFYDTSWLGPLVNDAINPGSFHDYGNV